MRSSVAACLYVCMCLCEEELYHMTVILQGDKVIRRVSNECVYVSLAWRPAGGRGVWVFSCVYLMIMFLCVWGSWLPGCFMYSCL